MDRQERVARFGADRALWKDAAHGGQPAAPSARSARHSTRAGDLPRPVQRADRVRGLRRGRRLVVPVFLLIVGAFTGEFSFLLFVALSVVLELLLIFGRPRRR